MKCSVFVDPPEGFHPAIEGAGCYCECAGKILFLKRHPERPQGNSWGVPGGKLEKNESPRDAVVREIKEEIGLEIDDHSLTYLGTLYCRLPHLDYVFHMFRKTFVSLPVIDLAPEEHLEMKWVTIEEAMQLPLMAGRAEGLKYYQHGFKGI